MKARIKHTDKIIDVEWNMFGWLFDSTEGKRIFNSEELVFLDNDNFDWQIFRNQAAKDILCAIISQPNLGYYGDEVETAIKFADKLISKLKEKEKK